MQLPFGLVLLLLFASGLLLSRIHFCLVAAVAMAHHGHWGLARAVALISLGISAVLLALALFSGRLPLQLAADGRVLLGGLLFGLAAAWNRGCFVGTSIQLAGGDLRALLSVGGWVLGFLAIGSPTELLALPPQPLRLVLALLALLLAGVGLARWAGAGAAARGAAPGGSGVCWRASIACGVMLGLVDNDLWRWDPSSLARTLAHPLALADSWQRRDPAPLLPLVLLAGMAANSLWQRSGRLAWPGRHDLLRLPYGMAMAAGAALAMGGNDTQLLRYLPGGSPHGWIAVPAMVAGIVAGLRCPAPLGMARR